MLIKRIMVYRSFLAEATILGEISFTCLEGGEDLVSRLVTSIIDTITLVIPIKSR